MKDFNFEKYVGVPFSDKGETLAGANCWTLARLIYKEEFGINLPSFSNKYELNDEAGIAELIAQYKEGWESVDSPQAGDLVLFRILGHESHVGVMIDAKRFVDIRENRDSVIDSIDSPTIRKRVVGFFRYSEKKSVVLNAVPHPLKTQRFTLDIPLGCNLRGIVDIIHNEYKVHEEYEPRMHIMLNGIVIPEDQWDTTFPKETDAVEYRVVPGKKAISFLAIIAVAIIAPYAAGALTGYTSAVAAAGMLGAQVGLGVTAAYYGTMAAISLVGNALISRISPVRPPSSPNDPGSTERQLMVTGGANRTNPYGSIPVVLGKVRMTPVLASNTYLTYESGRDSYLSMLLCWGYGPLQIDRTSFKIGDIPLVNYVDSSGNPTYVIETLDRKVEEDDTPLNQIYGNDVDQVQVNLDLTCDGNPQFVPDTYSGSSVYNAGTNTSVMTAYFNDSLTNLITGVVGQSVEATFTAPAGIAAWTVTHQYLSDVVITTVNSTTKKITGTINSLGVLATQPLAQLTVTGNVSGTYVVNNLGVAPGPWLQTSSLQAGNYQAKVAIHFPQGLRYIIIKGDNAGKTRSASVGIRFEQSLNGTTWTALDYKTITANNKDAFTEVFNFNTSSPFIRIRRETGDNTEDNSSRRYYFQSTLLSVAYVSNQRPATDPVGTKIAKTAIRIKATDQLSGNMEGINGIVQTWCKTWNGTSWVMGVSNNPADLMRYVLEHPGNPRKITSDNQLDLPAIQAFHAYCSAKGFEYNSILASQRSVLEVLRDICAAGRASPSLKDGKWTVIIDEAKSIVQHFTPHNSWGFEGSKALPRYPHGLRVNFFDEAKNYQEVETIVYDAGYGPTNADIFESINLPGVTKSSLVTDHAKWHFAQAKLRPEVYTLNTDIEYLVCNRGDRVKVMHDVPMWGIGSGRVKNTRMNLLLRSEELDTSPWAGNVSAVLSAEVFEGVSFWTLSKTTTGSSERRSQGLGNLAAGSRTLTLAILKGSGPSEVDIGIIISGSNATGTASARVISGPGTLSTVYGAARRVSNLSDTVPTVLEFTKTHTLTAPWEIGIYPGNAGSTTIGDSVKVAKLQIEEGSASSGYIRSTSLRGTAIDLDEDVPMQANVSYAARIRTDNGNSFQLRTRPVLTDGYYSTLEVGTFTTGFTPLGSFNLVDGSNTGTLKPLDLVLFGEVNQEAQDLTVISIEPAENKSARLTLVDYGVTDTYNIFTDYLNYTSAIVFESQITQPAKLQLNSFGDSVPTITGFVSDESVMEQISAGVFQYNMNVGYYNPYQLPVGTTLVEAQYDFADATDTVGSKYARSDFQTSNVNIKDVAEGVTYKVRLRYISELGVVGKWSEYSNHAVSGKSNPPDSVQAVVVNADKASGNLTVLWDKNLEIDVDKYEIRRVDSGWGTENSDLLYLGDATTAILPFAAGFTYYIKAVDFFGNYSLVATPVTYASAAVVAPNNLRFSFSTIALTNVLCAFRWDQVSTSEFNIAYYEFEYDGIIEKVQSTAFDVQSFWLGYKTFTVRAVDIHEQRSLPATIIVEKRVPAAVTNVRTQVIDNTVMLYWSLPEITTLPIDHIMIKRGPSWASPDLVIGQKKGEFTVSIENTGGNFTYWLAAVDTSGAESTPVSVTAVVAEPPDFIFYGEFISDLSGTLSNAVYNERKVTAPVDTSETWESHFTARTWDTPQAQIDALYPYYAQPNLSPAYYEEVFDFGTTLASSRIQVLYSGTIVVNSITTFCTISTSDDGTTYTDYEGVTSIYGTNFRYVKVKIDIIAATDKGLYDLERLSVKLDSKLITDAGRADLVSTDTAGTIVNFNKTFIDVQALTLSAGGTTAATPVYNFKDNVGSGTYSVVSNVCTVTKTAHGLIAGQNVELFISSGNGLPGVYTITSATTDTFTVSMLVGNTSGNNLIYPQSFTAYLFNSSGTRVSGSISWSVRGY